MGDEKGRGGGGDTLSSSDHHVRLSHPGRGEGLAGRTASLPMYLHQHCAAAAADGAWKRPSRAATGGEEGRTRSFLWDF